MMHLSGYAVERKGLRNGIAELLQTWRDAAGREKRGREIKKQRDGSAGKREEKRAEDVASLYDRLEVEMRQVWCGRPG